MSESGPPTPVIAGPAAAILAPASTFANIAGRGVLLAIAWLMLALHSRTLWIVLAVGLAAAGLVAGRSMTIRYGARASAAACDAGVAVMLVVIILGYRSSPVLIIVVGAVAGVLRGAGDRSHQALRPDTGMTGGSPGTLVAIGGGAVFAGLGAGWLGATGILWLLAVAQFAGAAMTAWPRPGTVPALTGTGGRTVRFTIASWSTSALFAAFAQAGAVTLVAVWVADVIRSTDAWGLIGAALLAGMFASAIAPATANATKTYGVIGGGYAIGAVATLAGIHLPAVAWAIAVIAFAAGTVFPAPQRPDVVPVDHAGNPRTAGITEAVAGLGAPVVAAAGVLGGLLVVRHTGEIAALVIGAAAFLIALAAPMLAAPETAGDAATDAFVTPLRDRYGDADQWVAVTLVYADGSWKVEVERKDDSGAGGHEVRSSDALRAIDILDLPGLREEIEQAIIADRDRAVNEAKRLRDELDGVGSKLTAIDEMVEWSELWRATTERA